MDEARLPDKVGQIPGEQDLCAKEVQNRKNSGQVRTKLHSYPQPLSQDIFQDQRQGLEVYEVGCTQGT